MNFDLDCDYPAKPARRRALQAAAGFSALPLAAALPFVDAAALAFAPAVFDAQADRALVWVSAHGAITAHVRWGLSPDALTQLSAVRAFDAASDFTGHVLLQNLPPGRTVHYRVFAGDKPVSEAGRFNTPRVAGQSLVLAFSGDMEERHKPFHIFDALSAAKPDFFMHLGDTVYADVPKRDFAPTLAHYRRKHAIIRADRPLQNFMAQCATFALWDDHEIQNDAHGGLAHIAIAEQVFREYWPGQTVSKTGLYRAVMLAPDVELIILDTRRFRSVQAIDDGPEKTMLGTQQKAWFLDRLKRSTARFKIVATSVPFHGSSADA